MSDAVLIRVQFDGELDAPSDTALGLAQEIEAAFRDGRLRWRAPSYSGRASAAAVKVEAWNGIRYGTVASLGRLR